MDLPFAYDPYSGEYLCPCGDDKYYSQQTGQVYCIICPGDPASVNKAWNPYDNQGYCICAE